MSARDPIELSCLQRWVQAVITHPDGVAAGVDSPAARKEVDMASACVEEIVERSQRLSSLERLHVYGNAYYARLLECLRDEFPAVAHAVGEETFNAFAFGYLQAHPSTSYTLGRLGAGFPRYLRETRPDDTADDALPGWPDFLIDLAVLERTYSEVFDGPGWEGRNLLSPEDLAAVPPERWHELRLVVVPCLRLVELRFPAHEYASAVRRGEDPAIPSSQPTKLVVTRREFVVRRQPVLPEQFVLLSALSAGRTLGAAIAEGLAAAGDDVARLSQDLRTWFAQWTAAGYFERCER